MIKINYKKLTKSEMINEKVNERLPAIVDKFPELSKSTLTVLLEMENAPTQAGPDLFKVKLFISGGKYNEIVIEKSDAHIYVALADVIEHLLEILNRFGDKERVINRNKERRFLQSDRNAPPPIEDESM